MLHWVQSAMAVRAAPTLFLAGRLRLRCRARLLGLYDSSDLLDVQEDAPQNMEQSTSFSHHTIHLLTW
ncbi:unnamed protein product [Callosobruchus maculatus]|uniref:Uncharacterized protein n=1 Tax=Callosobruchus maculatus TaxID=64391 RepID=A0A653DGX5_CALMS|nr:unnamed protein product [Callosobruchus maculatus]